MFFQNSLRSVYEHLRAVEMKRVDSAAKDTGNRTIAAVSLQLQDFLKARIELIELYKLDFLMFTQLIAYFKL